MKTKYSLITLTVLTSLSPLVSATPLGTAFTYQGKLTDGSAPASGTYDLVFTLFDAASGPTAVAGPLTNSAVGVINGLFTVTLDFGLSAFSGDARWLEIAARTNGTGAFATFPARQPLTGAPYALYAANAGFATTASSASVAASAHTVASNSIVSASIAPGQVVKSLNGLQDAVVLAAGPNVVLATNGNTLLLSAQAGGSTNDWSLAGNVGTTPGANFLGTLDNQPLELKVSNQRVLRLEPTGSTPNIIGGGELNSIEAGVIGATISGGGSLESPYAAHHIYSDFATIGGGLYILAEGKYSTVGGGIDNYILSSSHIYWGTPYCWYSTIAGGQGNLIGSENAAICGGAGNMVLGHESVVAGGTGNTIGYGARSSAITGGNANQIQTNGSFVTVLGFTNILAAYIGGGVSNLASGAVATIGGGLNNAAHAPGSFVGGGEGNAASGAQTTVAGGLWNTASGEQATVAGGELNTASNRWTSVGGGRQNVASGDTATVGGGAYNAAGGNGATVGGGEVNSASGEGSFVGGGAFNTASGYAAFIGGGGEDGTIFSGNSASGAASTIGGGLQNTAGTTWATVGGGFGNAANGNSSFIGGGMNNRISFYAGVIGGGENNRTLDQYATVGGGYTNTASGIYAAVGGGSYNTAGSSNAIVSGGYGNTATNAYTTVAGGMFNQARQKWAAVGGGYGNNASGGCATVPGGNMNWAGGDWSFAAGSHAMTSSAGSFVWGDSTGKEIWAMGDNQFVARATGGFWFITAVDATGLPTCQAYLGPCSPSWSITSDRDQKENFRPVDHRTVLEKLAQMPVTEWSMKGEKPGIRHIGPVAQDFHAAFGLGGADDRRIVSSDEAGVALAAIQGLNEKVESGKLKAENRMERLEAENVELKQRLDRLERLLTQNSGGGQ